MLKDWLVTELNSDEKTYKKVSTLYVIFESYYVSFWCEYMCVWGLMTHSFSIIWVSAHCFPLFTLFAHLLNNIYSSLLFQETFLPFTTTDICPKYKYKYYTVGAVRHYLELLMNFVFNLPLIHQAKSPSKHPKALLLLSLFYGWFHSLVSMHWA